MYLLTASTKAYGAVAFLCRKQETSFVMAKSRVAPLKALTLPKLELMAEVVATRLSNFIIHSLTLQQPSIYLWTDSQIVLHWIQSTKSLPQLCYSPDIRDQANIARCYMAVLPNFR